MVCIFAARGVSLCRRRDNKISDRKLPSPPTSPLSAAAFVAETWRLPRDASSSSSTVIRSGFRSFFSAHWSVFFPFERARCAATRPLTAALVKPLQCCLLAVSGLSFQRAECRRRAATFLPSRDKAKEKSKLMRAGCGFGGKKKNAVGNNARPGRGKDLRAASDVACHRKSRHRSAERYDSRHLRRSGGGTSCPGPMALEHRRGTYVASCGCGRPCSGGRSGSAAIAGGAPKRCERWTCGQRPNDRMLERSRSRGPPRDLFPLPSAPPPFLPPDRLTADREAPSREAAAAPKPCRARPVARLRPPASRWRFSSTFLDAPLA